VLPYLLKIAENSTNSRLLDPITWIIYNLCMRNPDKEYLRSAVPTLCKIIQTQKEHMILTQSLLALFQLTGSDQAREIVINSGTLPTLVSLLKNYNLVLPSLKCIGRIAEGSEAHTRTLLQAPEFLTTLLHLLDHRQTTLRKEVCWILSNLVAEDDENIELLFLKETFIEKLMGIAINDEHTVVTEAGHAILNLVCVSKLERIPLLYEKGILKTLVTLTNKDSDNLILLGLEGFVEFINRTAGISYQEQNLQDLCFECLKESTLTFSKERLNEMTNPKIKEKISLLHNIYLFREQTK